jgi:nitrile hydratase
MAINPVPIDAGIIRGVILASGEAPLFSPSDRVEILARSPVGHYRVPMYLRGKFGVVHSIVEPSAVDNEEEGYGRNAGSKRHYYRVSFLMSEVWARYAGSPRDELRIEVFETWLVRARA